MARPMSCSTGLRSLPSMGAGQSRRNGFDVNRTKSRKATAIQAWTDRTSARSRSGRFWLNTATSAPNSARISTHRSIDPSWFPQTPVIL